MRYREYGWRLPYADDTRAYFVAFAAATLTLRQAVTAYACFKIFLYSMLINFCRLRLTSILGYIAGREHGFVA